MPAITYGLDQLARNTVEAQAEAPLFAAGHDPHEPLFVATLRPYERGQHARPILELLALAFAMSAEFAVFITTARVWSLDDPINPVTADGDLRQRALVGHACTRDTAESWLEPFDETADGEITWHEPIRPNEQAQGWVPEAIRTALSAQPADTPSQPAEQLHRCRTRGHDVLLCQPGTDLLAADLLANA